MKAVAGPIQELQLVGLEAGFLDGVTGAEAVLHGDVALQLAQLGVHHRPQVPGGVVMEFDHPARLPSEEDGHPAADVRCGNRHRGEQSKQAAAAAALPPSGDDG